MHPIYTAFRLLFAVILLSGCGKPSPNNQPGNAAIEFDKPYVLANGQGAQTVDKGLTIHFDKVSGDNRCPAGANCIWAGSAKVDFTLTTADTTAKVTLYSLQESDARPRIVTFDGYYVKLAEVKPERPASEDIPQEKYVVSVVVKSLKEE
jgi:hypothetical protein